MTLLSTGLDDDAMQDGRSEAFHSQAFVADLMHMLGSTGPQARSQVSRPLEDCLEWMHDVPRAEERITPSTSLAPELLSNLFKLRPQREHLFWSGILRRAITASEAAHRDTALNEIVVAPKSLIEPLPRCICMLRGTRCVFAAVSGTQWCPRCADRGCRCPCEACDPYDILGQGEEHSQRMAKAVQVSGL